MEETLRPALPTEDTRLEVEDTRLPRPDVEAIGRSSPNLDSCGISLIDFNGVLTAKQEILFN